ncbi:uncharacterized protein LOC143340628 [Colletes latitarsis]|uniref:uncharacterized protein LOC143340628 n=1 Tax=Colletes latitarsis TaxID=2605962 RepID=UPI004036262C
MVKEKKVLKLTSKVKTDKIINVTKRTTNVNMKRKQSCGLLQHKKKASLKKNIKQNKATKLHKILSNKQLESKEEMCKHQIQKLNQILQQPLEQPMLTKDELKLLFMKYKLDGHYRTNENLPPFPTLLNNMFDTIKESDFLYNKTQYTTIPNVQRPECRSSQDIFRNLYLDSDSESQYTKDNLSMYKNVQQTLKQETWKPQINQWKNNMDDRSGNKYLYVERNPTFVSDYNYTPINHNIQTCNDRSVFTDIQNIDQSELDLNFHKVSNMEGEFFSPNLINGYNSHLEGHQNIGYTNKNLILSVSDSTLQYENLQNNNEITKQSDIHCAAPYKDLLLNSNIYDFHLKEWDKNTSLINRNCNYESWKSEQSISVPQVSNLKFYDNVKNYSEEDMFNSHIHRNVYPFVNNEHLVYAANNNNINVQQDINTYSSNTTAISENYLPQAN